MRQFDTRPGYAILGKRGSERGYSERAEVMNKHNRETLKAYFEDRWHRGIPRDFTAPDLWGDNPAPKKH